MSATVQSRPHRHDFDSLLATPASPQWSPKAGPSRIPLDAPVSDPHHDDRFSNCFDNGHDGHPPRGLGTLFDDDVDDPRLQTALMLTKSDNHLAELDKNQEKMDAAMKVAMDPSRTLEERQLAADIMESLAVESQIRARRLDEEAQQMKEYVRRLEAELAIQKKGIMIDDEYEEYEEFSGSEDGSDLEVYEEVPIHELRNRAEELSTYNGQRNLDSRSVDAETPNDKGKGKAATNDIEEWPSKDKGKGKAKADVQQCDCPRHRRERELCGQGNRKSRMDDFVTLPSDMDIDSILASINKRAGGRYKSSVQSDITNPAASFAIANSSAAKSEASKKNPEAVVAEVDKALAMGEDQGFKNPANIDAARDLSKNPDSSISAILKDADIARSRGPKPVAGDSPGVSSKRTLGKTSDSLRRLAADNNMFKGLDPMASIGMPTRSGLDFARHDALAELMTLSGMGMGMPGMPGLGGASNFGMEIPSMPGLGGASGFGMEIPGMMGLGGASGLGTTSKRLSTSALLKEMEKTLAMDAANLGMYDSMGFGGMPGLGLPDITGLGAASGLGKNRKRSSGADIAREVDQGLAGTGSHDATRNDSGHKGSKVAATNPNEDEDDLMAEMERSISASASGTLSELDKSIAMLSDGLKDFDVEKLQAMLEGSDNEDDFDDDEDNWSEKVEMGSVASADSTDTIKGAAGDQSTEAEMRNEDENHLLTEAQAMEKDRVAKEDAATEGNNIGEQTGTVDQNTKPNGGLEIRGRGLDEGKDQVEAHLSSAGSLTRMETGVVADRGEDEEMADCPSEDGTGERPRKRKRAEAEA